MTEHVLPYDRSVVPQETSWDCGPASAQVALNSRGILFSEDDLIRQIGTTEDGTAYVGLVQLVLAQLLPDANYVSVYLTNDPPTQQQKDQLWVDITHSIDAGYAVVMNWVAPPGNYPIGVKGSESPAYGGGTVFHYVCCPGYDDAPGGRALWIADSGFRPFGYWISFEQAASLIPPKGYTYADARAVAPPAVAPPRPAAVDVLAAATGLTGDSATQLLPAVSAGLQAAQCTNINRIAMWLAQCGEESDGFNTTEEYASGAEYDWRTDLGNTTAGDGVRFKGRTWIQITGRAHYAEFSQWAFDRGIVDNPTYFVDNPTALGDLQYAGVGAAWYWTVERPDINTLSDQGDVYAVTLRINGGTNGLDERRRRWNLALAQGDALLTLTTPTGGPLMALTDDEQRELLTKTREIWDQLRGPDGAGWSELGERADGKSTRTPVDALAHLVGDKDA